MRVCGSRKNNIIAKVWQTLGLTFFHSQTIPDLDSLCTAIIVLNNYMYNRFFFFTEWIISGAEIRFSNSLGVVPTMLTSPLYRSCLIAAPELILTLSTLNQGKPLEFTIFILKQQNPHQQAKVKLHTSFGVYKCNLSVCTCFRFFALYLRAPRATQCLPFSPGSQFV